MKVKNVELGEGAALRFPDHHVNTLPHPRPEIKGVLTTSRHLGYVPHFSIHQKFRPVGRFRGGEVIWASLRALPAHKFLKFLSCKFLKFLKFLKP